MAEQEENGPAQGGEGTTFECEGCGMTIDDDRWWFCASCGEQLYREEEGADEPGDDGDQSHIDPGPEKVRFADTEKNVAAKPWPAAAVVVPRRA